MRLSVRKFLLVRVKQVLPGDTADVQPPLDLEELLSEDWRKSTTEPIFRVGHLNASL
jgi:hypothetical protein